MKIELELRSRAFGRAFFIEKGKEFDFHGNRACDGVSKTENFSIAGIENLTGAIQL